MDRIGQIRKFVTRDKRGIEVAPYFNPIVSRRDGFNVLILDVFDTERLRQNAANDPNIPRRRIAEIEDVDIVADASGIGEEVEKRQLAGKIDYIVSSHNFEHLPDPVRFLQGCAHALAPGGTLSMAIPDYRACFDHFRMPTRLSDWISAHHRALRQPTAETHLDFSMNFSLYGEDKPGAVGCNIDTDDPRRFNPPRTLRSAYADYRASLENGPGPYRDAHCSTVFGASFELMVRDLRHIGLLDLYVEEVTPTYGLEFYAHLRKPEAGSPPETEAEFYARRDALLLAVNRGLADAGFGRFGPRWPDASKPPVGDPALRRLARAIRRKVRG